MFEYDGVKYEYCPHCDHELDMICLMCGWSMVGNEDMDTMYCRRCKDHSVPTPYCQECEWNPEDNKTPKPKI